MNIKEKIREGILGYRASSESYIRHLRKIGVSIGDDVVLFRPYNTTIDMQNPHLLTIGNHVMVTGPVTILTHDYGWSVLKRKYGEILGNQKPVNIGDNVFLGWGCTILAGTTIGSNTIVGANSVCSGRIEGDSVYAGNPAKRIMSLQDYYEKRKSRQRDEAYTVVKEYYKRFNKLPEAEIMSEYFYLFVDRTDSKMIKKYESKLRLMDNYEESILALSKPEFNGWEEFLTYCRRRIEEEENV